MNLYLRLLEVILRSWWERRAGPLTLSRVPMWVRPWDCDGNLHMNNGRYLTVMDLGRFHLMGRAKLLGLMLRRRWFPVMAAADIHYSRALRPFERYVLETEVVCWDERWFYMEQRFVTAHGVVARGRVKGGFFADGQSVAPALLLEAAGVHDASPAMPASFASWAALHTTRAGGTSAVQ